MANSQDILLTYRTDTGEVTKSFDEIIKGLEEVDKKVDDTSKKTEDVGKKAKESGKEGASGFKILDVAMKSTGILFIIDKFIQFSAVLLENKRVAETLEVVMAAIGTVMNQIFETVEPLADSLIHAFKNPKEAVLDFGNTIKEFVLNRVQAIVDGIGLLGKAISLVFEGKFGEAAEAAKEGFKNIAYEGTLLQTVVETTTEVVGEFVTRTVAAVKQSNELTRSQQKLRDAFRNLNVTQAQTLAQIEEIQRARDDEGNSIDERIEKAIEAAELEQKFADQRLSIANQEVAQLEQQIRLQGPLLELEKNLADARIKAAEEARSAGAIQIGLLEFIVGLEQQRIDLQDELYKESLKFYDAEEQALLEQYDQRIAIAGDDEGLQRAAKEALERDLAELGKKYADEEQRAKFQAAAKGFQALAALAQAFEYREDENAEGRSEKAERRAKRQFRIQKALSLATASITATESVIAAFKSAKASPLGALPGYAATQAALAAAFGAAQIVTIARTKYGSPELPQEGSGGEGGGGGTFPAPTSPQLDLGFLGAGAGQTGFRTYVVSSEVSNAQQANQRINDQASLVG